MLSIDGAPPVVSQASIDAYWAAKNEARRVIAHRHLLARQMIDLLNHGATVEPGAHTAEIVVRWKRGAQIRRLKVR